MTNAAFKLQDSGFSREQVEALTEFMVGGVATKEDIAHVEGKIVALEGKIMTLEGKIIVLEGKIVALEGKIAALEDKIITLEGKIETQGERHDGRIEALRGELKADIRVLHWMFGVLVAGVASLIIKTFFG